MPWQPTTVRRPGTALRTATDTVPVVTDAGPGYLKALGNHGGPHLLAAEWVATQLAQWMGLPTFEFALIEVTHDDEIEFLNGQRALPGPAFITRSESGMVWSGKREELELLVNPEDIGRLVLFDTWTRNCDRHPPDPTLRKPNRNNVFFSNVGLPDGQFRLLAMDHTHCFNCGRDLTATLANIDQVQDERTYGLFPEFHDFVHPDRFEWAAAVAQLRTLDRNWVRGIVGSIPREWLVEPAGRDALVRLICDRANFVADRFCPAMLGWLI